MSLHKAALSPPILIHCPGILTLCHWLIFSSYSSGSNSPVHTLTCYSSVRYNCVRELLHLSSHVIYYHLLQYLSPTPHPVEPQWPLTSANLTLSVSLALWPVLLLMTTNTSDSGGRMGHNWTMAVDSLSHTPLPLSPVVYRYLVYNILMRESTCVECSMQCVLMEWTAVTV